MPTATYTLNVFNAAGTAASTAPSATVSVAPGFWSSLNTTTFAGLRGVTVTALDNGKMLIAGGVDGTNTPQSTACATRPAPARPDRARRGCSPPAPITRR